MAYENSKLYSPENVDNIAVNGNTWTGDVAGNTIGRGSYGGNYAIENIWVDKMDATDVSKNSDTPLISLAGTFGIKGCTFSNTVITKAIAGVKTANWTVVMRVTGNANIQDTVFYDNNGVCRGTLLVSSSGRLNITGSTFSGNTTTQYSAGIHSNTTGNIIISGSTFIQNATKTHGGAVSSQEINVITISGTEDDKMIFYGNTANTGGAIAIGNTRGCIKVTGATFTGNVANEDGGAAYNLMEMEFNSENGTRTVFDSNSAKSDGGAISHVDKWYAKGYYVTKGILYFGDTHVVGYTEAKKIVDGNALNTAYTKVDSSAVDTAKTGKYIGLDETSGKYVSECFYLDSDILYYGERSFDTEAEAVAEAGKTINDFKNNSKFPTMDASCADTSKTPSLIPNIGNGDYYVADLVVNGADFIKNSTDVHGGAIIAGGTYHVNDAVFTGNTAKGNGGAIYSSGKNNSFLWNNEQTIDNSQFINNVATGAASPNYGCGGAIFVDGGTLNMSSNFFSGNTAAVYGGAIYVTSDATLNFNGGTFKTDTDTVFVEGKLNLSGNIELNADVTSSGSKASITVTNGANITFDNSTDISVSNMVFAGNNKILLKGDKTVTVSNWDLTGVDLSVDTSSIGSGRTLMSGISNIGNNTFSQVSDGLRTFDIVFENNALVAKTLNIIVKDSETFTAAKAAITAGEVSNIVFNVLPENESLIIDVEEMFNVAENSFSASNPLNIKNDTGKTVIFDGTNSARFMKIAAGNNVSIENINVQNFCFAPESDLYGAGVYNSGDLDIKGATFANNKIGNGTHNGKGGAIYNSGVLNVEKTLFTGNTAQFLQAGHGGAAIYNGNVANIINCNFEDNVCEYGIKYTDSKGNEVQYNGRGAAIFSSKDSVTNIYGGYFKNNHNVENNEYGSIYTTGGTINIYGYTAADNTVTEAVFTENEGGVIALNGGTLNVNDAKFTDNGGNSIKAISAVDNGANNDNDDEVNASKRANVTINGVEFNGNINGAIELRGSDITIKDSSFVTKLDSITVSNNIYNKDKDGERVLNIGKCTFSGTVQLAANILGDGQYKTVDADLIFINNEKDLNLSLISFDDLSTITFNGTYKVNFNAAGQSLSNVAITVDGNRFAGQAVTIASNITDIGTVTVTNNADNKLEAVLVGTDLVLKEKATISAGDVITENKINHTSESLITGGEIKAVFVGTDLTSGNVNTEVQGGKFSKFFVGGALVKTESADMGTVTVTVSGGEFADRIYGAGYAYGIGDVDADTVELRVAKSEVVLSGGTVNDGVFGGAHARKNAHVLVDAV
ncbi:MAG: hypothetical protein IKA71_06780, partial [Lentisphaeria bacterium]|nr:hypothetical protein [Lentisphaeria bacterium]